MIFICFIQKWLIQQSENLKNKRIHIPRAMIYFNQLKLKKKEKKRLFCLFFFKYCINDAGENCKSSESFYFQMVNKGVELRNETK